MEIPSFYTIVEITAVILSLIYLFLLIKEIKYCWYFGIAGSLLSISLFYHEKLYSEAILYVYYVVIGVYGLYLWSNPKNSTKIPIITWKLTSHVFVIFLGILLSLGLGYIFETYTDATNAYLDAFTTIFSFIASYMEAKKVLSTWHFWIILNGVTIWLYSQKGLDIYGFLTAIYFGFSFFGLYQWRKQYLLDYAGN